MNKKIIIIIGITLILLSSSSTALIDLTGTYHPPLTDGSNITNINASNITTGFYNPFNQDLNTTNNATFTYLDITNDVVADAFHGDGGNLTNLSASEISGFYNPFNQDLNTTNTPTFENITVGNITMVSGDSYILNPYGDIYFGSPAGVYLDNHTFLRNDYNFYANGSNGYFGNLTVTDNITGNIHYAEAYFHDHNGVSIDFTQDYRYNLTYNATEEANGFTFDGDGNLTCLKAGLYSVNFQASGDGQNNHEYYLGVAVNHEIVDKTEVHKKMAAGGDVTTMVGTGFIRLALNDIVSLQIYDISAGGGISTYFASNLNLIRIGD